jgi:RhoGAP domain
VVDSLFSSLLSSLSSLHQAERIADLEAQVAELNESVVQLKERFACTGSESPSDSPRCGVARRTVPPLGLHSSVHRRNPSVGRRMDAVFNPTTPTEQPTPVMQSPRLASSPKLADSPRGTLSRQKNVVDLRWCSPRDNASESEEMDRAAVSARLPRAPKSADEAIREDDFSLTESERNFHRTAPVDADTGSELSVDDGEEDILGGSSDSPFSASAISTTAAPNLSSASAPSSRKLGGDVPSSSKSNSRDAVERSSSKGKRKEKASFFNKFKGTVRGRRRVDVLSAAAAGSDESPRLAVSAPVMTGSTLVPGQRDQLLMLLQMRQSRESLMQKKILPRRSLFGVPLDTLLEGEDNIVPGFLVRLLKYLRSEGGNDPELFEATSAAVSGSLDVRATLCSGLPLEEPELPGMAVQVLLQFLRELPEPLCTQQLFHEFVDVAEISAPDLRLSCLQSLVYRLPPSNRQLLQQLVSCLRQICSKSKEHSLLTAAATFAPALFRDIGSDWQIAHLDGLDPSSAASTSSPLGDSTGGGPSSLSMGGTQSPRSWRDMTLSDDQRRQRKVLLLEIMFRDHDHLFYGQRRHFLCTAAALLVFVYLCLFVCA